MASYVNENGVQKKEYQRIRADLAEGVKGIFGLSADTDPATPLGQLVSLFSYKIYELWEGLQELFNGFNPSNASGLSLDLICDLLGITRIGASPSSAACVCYGDYDKANIFIPRGSIIKNNADVKLTNPYSGYISPDSCSVIVLQKQPDFVGEFLLYIDSVAIAVSANSTTNEIVNAVGAALAGRAIEADYYADGQNPGNFANMGFNFEGEYFVVRRTNEVSFGVGFLIGFNVLKIGSLLNFQALSNGAAAIQEHAFTIIEKGADNWQGVDNPFPAQLGQERETDSQLRLRRNAQYSSGVSTIPNMEFALLNGVPGVTYARIFENSSNETHNGIPPHSIMCLVNGGAQKDVAEMLYKTKPAGIGTEGAIEVSVTDNHGNQYAIKFARGKSIEMQIKIYYKFAENGTLSDGWQYSVKEAIMAWWNGNSEIGLDIVPEKFLIPAYQTANLGSCKVAVGRLGGTLQFDTLELNADELAVLKSENISFVYWGEG